MSSPSKRAFLLCSAFLFFTAVFILCQILYPRADRLYLILCIGFVPVGIADVLLQWQPKRLLWVLLCLFYLQLPMVWRTSSVPGSASWLRWNRDFVEFIHIPVGCVVWWIVRMRALLSAK